MTPSGRDSSVRKALVSKFDDKVTVEVAESTNHSDPIDALSDYADKLIEVSRPITFLFMVYFWSSNCSVGRHCVSFSLGV